MDLTRPTSAPPAFLGEDAQVPDDIAPDDLRLSPAYYKFYYSQRPLDPRLPPPLVRYSREEGAAKQRLAFDCSPLGPGLLPEKPKLSPLEMIQSDFPRTSSPIYLSSSEDKVYVPSKSTVPSSYQPVGRQSPAITRSPLSNAFGATLTSCSSSSSSISSLEASIVHPALSRPVDIASGLQALSIDDEETTAPCTLSRAASEDNFVRHFSTRRSSVPSLSTPFGYSQPSAQYPSISPMMAVMGGYSQSRDSFSSCFQSQGPGAFEQLGRPGSEGFVDYSRASESDAYFESSYWDSRYVQHRGAFTEGNIEHIERRGHRNRSRRASASSDTGTRHVLLQELRSNKNVDLDEVIAQCVVAEFAIDQNGSRYIQQSLEGATAQQKELLFEQLSLEILNLCVDVFGNYVIQKFLELGLPSHRAVLADTLVGNVLALSLQMYGCRVIQKALEVIPRDMQVLLVKELDGHVLKCVKDQNGNHVIQKVIERIPAENIDFIVNAFTGNVFSLSTHAYGCRVIQRLLEYCSEEQKTPILEEILDRVLDLVTDQYGNYVIQHVLQRGALPFRTAIIQQINMHVMELSKHKFASNVIEKCFAYASLNEKSLLVSQMIGDETCCPLAEMVKDQYGNYVVQKVLGVVNDEERSRIIETIRLRVPNLRKIPYGKHIVSRVEKLTGKIL